jgi:hypothetical protein
MICDGAIAANWFGTLLCLPFTLAPARRDKSAAFAVAHGALLLALSVFAPEQAFLSSWCWSAATPATGCHICLQF